ncbi:MAG: hypothetical protein H6727_13900 [Myxococcales bacterium]|nr:hypothetical protein [Myxococcales bacterium]
MRLTFWLPIFLASVGLAFWSCSAPPTQTAPCSGPSDCPNATCDTTLGICVSIKTPSEMTRTEIPENRTVFCTATNQCPSGSFCDQGQCIPGCGSDADCPDQQSCLANKICGNCAKNGDCLAGLTCQKNRCINCELDAQCQDGEYCDSNTGLCRTRCKSRENCPAGWVCAAQRCAYCKTDEECAQGEICLALDPTQGEASTRLCTTGCRTSDKCDKDVPFCDLKSQKCVACLEDKDCSDGLLCKQGSCTPCQHGDCPQNAFCVGAKQRCITNGCNNDDDCMGRPNLPFCDPVTSTCVACVDSQQCQNDPQRTLCKDNKCSLCERDTDCPPQQICTADGCKSQACRTHIDCFVSGGTSIKPDRYCLIPEKATVGTCVPCDPTGCGKNICDGNNCSTCQKQEDCSDMAHCVLELGVCAPGGCTTWDDCARDKMLPPPSPLGQACIQNNCKACTSVLGPIQSTGLEEVRLIQAYEGYTTPRPFIWTSNLKVTERNLKFKWNVQNPPPGLIIGDTSSPTLSMYGTFGKPPTLPVKKNTMTLELTVTQLGWNGEVTVCQLKKQIEWTLWSKLEQNIAGKPLAHKTLPLIVWRPYAQGKEIDLSSYVKGGGSGDASKPTPSFRCSRYQGTGQGVTPNIFDSTNTCKLKAKDLLSSFRPRGYFGFLMTIADNVGQSIELPLLVIPNDCNENKRKVTMPLDPKTNQPMNLEDWTPLATGQQAVWSVRIEDASYSLLRGGNICGTNFKMWMETQLIPGTGSAPSGKLGCSNNQPICIACPAGCSLCDSGLLCRSRNAPSYCFTSVTFSYDVKLDATPPLRVGAPAFKHFALKHEYDGFSNFSCQISLFEPPTASTPPPTP